MELDRGLVGRVNWSDWLQSTHGPIHRHCWLLCRLEDKKKEKEISKKKKKEVTGSEEVEEYESQKFIVKNQLQ